VSNQTNALEKRKNEIIGIILIALGILSGVAIFSDTSGLIGKIMADFYYKLTGTGAYLFPVGFIIWGFSLIRFKTVHFNLRITGFMITYIAILALYHLYVFSSNPLAIALSGNGGGALGGFTAWITVELFGITGSYVVICSMFLIGALLWSDVLLHAVLKKIKHVLVSPLAFIKIKYNQFKDYQEKLKKEKNLKTEIKDSVEIDDYHTEEAAVVEKPINKSVDQIIDDPQEFLKEDFNIRNDVSELVNKPEDNKGDYQLPGLDLLDNTGNKKVRLTNKKDLLEETLRSFGVEATVKKVNHGPTITRYEVQPATGVKVSKIVNLADDIALSLAARDVRIEAPIPGKAAVGIEVPHGADITVSFSDVIAARNFQKSKGGLNLALGKGIDGDTVVADLTKMPHLLVAGATGSGKSVCINTMIASLLYKNHPDEVKLLLVDPKKVELSHYKGLPHLLTPVVTDPKKAANVLKLVVEEMENRYELFSETGSRGIDSYNNQCKDSSEKLPYIVVIIDELSDLMMVAASDVEDNICRLAQMSRAAGIHLIIATQRPSVDVITGLIKANIPSRISFAVSSQTDSRTILDMGGAEKLLGKGDMLFAPVGMQKPQRIQGAFMTNKEIKRIVNFTKKQIKADYEIEPDDIKEIELSLDDDQDELYEKAVLLVVKYRASISMLQRRLHIGHSRAARLIDQMEEDGIVGPYAGSKPREVLIEESELEEYIGNDDDVKDESSEYLDND